MEQLLDSVFQKPIDSGSFAGAAAVALDRDGTVLFSKGYGHININDAASPKVTPDTPLMVYSMTKLVTCVAMLQLIEQGKANIMDSAAKYYPAISDLPVIKQWRDDSSPELVKSEKEILLLHLFTHTSGLAYDFFTPDNLRWRLWAKQTPARYVESVLEAFMSPLHFEPGTRWEYGVGIDFLGLIVEKISGMPLDQYIDAHIVQPLGLKNTVAQLSESQKALFYPVHAKDTASKLTPAVAHHPPNPEIRAGGQYLYSTASDYSQFLLALLNNGTHPVSHTTILKAETVQQYLFTDLLPVVGCPYDGVGALQSAIPPATNAGELLPGVRKGHSCGGVLSLEDKEGGRRKGSLAWAGLGNCYYWVDPVGGKLGVVTNALLPFMDGEAVGVFEGLERAVYEEREKVGGEVGEKVANMEVQSVKAEL